MLFLRRKLPSFFIVGVQKAGSNSLTSYLDQHPDLFSSRQKETDYFIKNKNMNLSEYAKYFKYKIYWPPNQQTFESSVGYIYFREVPEKIYNYNTDAKFILLLRHPVERAISAWKMYQNFFRQRGKTSWNSLENVYKNYFNWLPTTSLEKVNELYKSKIDYTPFQYFKEEIEDIEKHGFSYSEPGFIEKGIYAIQFENYLRFFPKGQFLVIESSDLANKTAETLNQVTDFLGCRKIDWRHRDLSRKHKSAGDIQLSEAEHSELFDFYRPYNKKLFDLINKEYAWK